MRATSVLRTILAFQHTFVTGVHFDMDALVIDVAPTYRVPRCSCCKRKVKAGYDQRPRTWRHLDLGGMLTLIRYAIRRVKCPKCGIKADPPNIQLQVRVKLQPDLPATVARS